MQAVRDKVQAEVDAAAEVKRKKETKRKLEAILKTTPTMKQPSILASLSDVRHRRQEVRAARV